MGRKFVLPEVLVGAGDRGSAFSQVQEGATAVASELLDDRRFNRAAVLQRRGLSATNLTVE
jgi:hypothetical protein